MTGRKSQQGDDGDAPGLEVAVEEEDEFTSMWRKLGLQPDRGQVNLVRKIQDRIEVIWQELRLVIIETFKKHGRMVYSEEEHQLKQELVVLVPYHGAAVRAATTLCHGSRTRTRILIS